jgi:hypothetical protein
VELGDRLVVGEAALSVGVVPLLGCHGNTAGLFHTNHKVMAVRAIMTNTNPTAAAIALHVHSWSFIGFI